MIVTFSFYPILVIHTIFNPILISQKEALVCDVCGKLLGSRNALYSHLMRHQKNAGKDVITEKGRIFTDLATKARIIIELENGSSYYDVCKKYNVIENTVRTFRLSKEAIFKELEECKERNIEGGVKKTLKRGRKPLVEEALFAWLVHQRRAKLYVDYSHLIKAACWINEKLHGDEWKGSKGFVAKFKSRAGILNLNFNIEDLSFVNESSCLISDSLRQRMDELELTDEDIMNCIDIVGNQMTLRKSFLKHKKRIQLKMKRLNCN